MREPEALIAAGVVGATATLTLPVFDVDSDPEDPLPPGIAAERDLIRLNGVPLGYFTGVTGQWVMNQFVVPIGVVRFPQRGVGGAAPIPMDNEIVVDIDTANTIQTWCTAVDWVALQIKALSPVILIHGNNSNGGFFDRQGFSAALRARRIPFDNSISMATASTRDNGLKLNDTIPAIARSFGVDSMHLIAHSKGGLDAREYLSRYQVQHDQEFKVLSLTTLSTPHNGTVLADVKEHFKAAAKAASVEFVGIPSFARTLAVLLPGDNGTGSLTVDSVATFNAATIPLLSLSTVFGTIAADADTNGNAQIDLAPDEYLELKAESPELTRIHNYPLVGNSWSRGIVDDMYRVLRNTASVSVRFDSRASEGLSLRTVEIAAVPSAQPIPNDTLVSVPSALGIGAFASRVANSATFEGNSGRNHSNVANGGVVATVVPWLFDVDRLIGDLK